MTNPITPQEAQQLLDGATPGPWEAYTVPGFRNEADYEAVSMDDREMIVPPRNSGMGTSLDAHLAAAAPRLAKVIAADTIQYGVEHSVIPPDPYEYHVDGMCEITDRGEQWSAEIEVAKIGLDFFQKMYPKSTYRLVARRVSPTWEVNNADL